MRYHVTHRTTYTYDAEVSNSLGIAFVHPRELPWQLVTHTGLHVNPIPADTTKDTDYYGNVVQYFQVRTPHTRLEIEAVSDVEVFTPVYDTTPFTQPWEQARPWETVGGAHDGWRAIDVAVESPLVAQTEEATAYAALALTPGRPIGEALTALIHQIHQDFAYDKTATTVTSTVDEIFTAKGGVCQDFAHLLLACVRSHGLAARYVSGYLCTTPPPGKDRVVGADASHAWVAVWIPPLPGVQGEGQWLALDPTNDTWVDDRYVTVAWGRDYADVPPVKGVIFTDAKNSHLDVSVDVAPATAG